MIETVDLCSSSEDEGKSPPPRKKEAEIVHVCLTSDDDGEENQKTPTADATSCEAGYGRGDDFGFNKPSKLSVNEIKGHHQKGSQTSDSGNTTPRRPIVQRRSFPSNDSSDEESDGIDRIPTFVATEPLTLTNQDDSSSDDDFLLTSILSKPLSKEEIRKRRRKEQEEEKSRRKEACADERERIKAQKVRHKEQERIAKETQKDLAKQRAGKFAKDEIVLIVAPGLPESVPGAFEQLEHSHGYKVVKHGDLDPGTIVFIRKDALDGGAQAAVDALMSGNAGGFEFIHQMVVIFADPLKFLDLLEKIDDNDDYPKLEKYLGALRKSWKSFWKQPNNVNPKISLLLPSVHEGLNKLWQCNARFPSERQTPPPRDFELEDAIIWCSVQFSVDVIPLSSTEELINFIQNMTRSHSEAPYKNPVTELECIKKAKSDVLGSATPLERANDAWERMLLVVPQFSLQRARNAVLVYPTALSLWNDYQDPLASEAQKDATLADCLGGKVQQLKASQTIYRLLTSSDPNELL